MPERPDGKGPNPWDPYSDAWDKERHQPPLETINDYHDRLSAATWSRPMVSQEFLDMLERNKQRNQEQYAKFLSMNKETNDES